LGGESYTLCVPVPFVFIYVEHWLEWPTHASLNFSKPKPTWL